MAEPIIEQIADAIKDVIDTVTVANGFHYTLAAVRSKRLHLAGDQNDDLNAFLIQENAARDNENLLTLETINWIQLFTIQVIGLDADDATTSIDTKLNRIASDIMKQMAAGTNINLAGLAERVLPAGIVFDFEDARVSAVYVQFEVHYHTDFGDPYNQNN